MPALSDKDQKTLRDIGLPPDAERAAQSVWENEKPKSFVTALGHSVLIVFSGLFVSSSYVPGLMQAVNVALLGACLIVAMYALLGILLVLISKTLPDPEDPKDVNLHFNRYFLKTWSGKHEPIYAVDTALGIMLAIAMAAGGFIALAFCYVAAVAVFRFGMYCLKDRTGKLVEIFAVNESDSVEKGDFRNIQGSLEGQCVRLS